MTEVGSSHHVSANGRLADLNAELENLAMDPRCTPQRVGCTHLPDQLTNLAMYFRSSGAAGSRAPAPVKAEALTVPLDHGCRFDQQHGSQAPWPQPIEPDPEYAIGQAQPWTQALTR